MADAELPAEYVNGVSKTMSTATTGVFATYDPEELADPEFALSKVMKRYEMLRAEALMRRKTAQETYRAAAESAWVARVARYYGKDEMTYTEADLPDYKARGSREWEDSVSQIMEQMHMADAAPMTPVPPFEVADWKSTDLVPLEPLGGQGYGYRLRSGMSIKADPRIERRLEHVVSDATKHHDMHARHVHPWCVECDVREGRAPGPDLENAGRSDDELRDDARGRMEARVRAWLLAERRIPEHPKVLLAQEEEVTERWHTLDDLAKMPAPSWLFGGLIPSQGVGYIIGRDGVKKTFLALDMALCAVTGQDFHGRTINEEAYNGAVFVAGEGVSSFGARCAAWAAARKHTWDDDDRSLFTAHAGAINLFKGGPLYDDMIERLKHQQPDLVVFDTLQRCAQGADQNSAADMAVITARLDEVKHASGGVVLVIAHTDKGDNDARGSSSIEDDADFVIHVKDKDGVVEARVTKQKDGETGSTLRLVAEAHVVGEAPVGHEAPVTSIALVDADEAHVAEAHAGNSPRLRIINALRLAHGERLDIEQVWRAIGTKESPVTKGHADNLLREMAESGEIRRDHVGGRKKAYYWLDPVTDAAVPVGESVVEPEPVRADLEG